MNHVKTLPVMILGILFIVNVCHMRAQENLIICLNDGTELAFRLQEISKLTFSDNSLWLNQPDREEKSFLYSEVRKLTFGNTSTGINTSPAEKTDIHIHVDFSSGNIQISNIPEKTTAIVYGLDGMILLQEQIDSNGNLPTGKLASGIYLLNINNRIFKFRRP